MIITKKSLAIKRTTTINMITIQIKRIPIKKQNSKKVTIHIIHPRKVLKSLKKLKK